MLILTLMIQFLQLIPTPRVTLLKYLVQSLKEIQGKITLYHRSGSKMPIIDHKFRVDIVQSEFQDLKCLWGGEGRENLYFL